MFLLKRSKSRLPEYISPDGRAVGAVQLLTFTCTYEIAGRRPVKLVLCLIHFRVLRFVCHFHGITGNRIFNNAHIGIFQHIRQPQTLFASYSRANGP